MVDGSPRGRKDIKFGGSATDMENNMDGTGRGMENMTMTVQNTAVTNMEMNNMDGTGRGMADMTMTVPDTAVTNTGTKNNMENTGMDMENMAMAVEDNGIDMESMAIAAKNAMTNMEKTVMEANGTDTEKTCIGTCMEMMDTKTMGSADMTDMEMEVQTMFSRVFNRVIRVIKNYKCRKPMVSTVLTPEGPNRSTVLTPEGPKM